MKKYLKRIKEKNYEKNENYCIDVIDLLFVHCS